MIGKNLQDKYVKDLEYNFLPFWEKSIDKEYGGVFTCFTNKGDKKVSDRKYTWSQGRFLWICCNLLKRESLFSSLSSIWEEAADKTYRFLQEHIVMPNNNVVYAVERDGEKISDQMNISIFADCFYVLGCNAYALHKKDVRIFDEILVIYQSIRERIKRNEFTSEPYPVPDAFKSHSIPMIFLNLSQEMYETARMFNHSSENDLYKDMQQNFNDIISNFVHSERIVEMLPDKEKDKQTLLARHVNPGHMLECIWFMAHSMDHLGFNQEQNHIKKLGKLAESALDIGWDEKYGGILRFVDKDGGEPKGERRNMVFEELILDTWDTKLWWPHSEALYTTLLLADMTDNDRWLSWYEQIEEYVFHTFPNKDNTVGEWIQIRNRMGDPSDKLVALPVKDPFHIIRNFLLISDLLGGK